MIRGRAQIIFHQPFFGKHWITFIRVANFILYRIPIFRDTICQCVRNRRAICFSITSTGICNRVISHTRCKCTSGHSALLCKLWVIGFIIHRLVSRCYAGKRRGRGHKIHSGRIRCRICSSREPNSTLKNVVVYDKLGDHIR